MDRVLKMLADSALRGSIWIAGLFLLLGLWFHSVTCFVLFGVFAVAFILTVDRFYEDD